MKPSSPRRPAHSPAPARRPKAAETVAAELRHRIVTGRLKPGDKLQPESILQAEFAISRPTMREALRVLEAESLISIRRGKHGGARVRAIDLGSASRQVGVFLQVAGTTLADVWFARTVLEPPAAGLVAARRDPLVLAELEANIEEAREAAKGDLARYADLSAGFSMLVTQHGGNRTLHLFALLIHDIIRRQHEHVTERTREDAGVDRLRQESLRTRSEVVRLMRQGKVTDVERLWRAHLERMRDLVLAAYDGPTTLDVLNKPAHRLRPVSRVRRDAPASIDA